MPENDLEKLKWPDGMWHIENGAIIPPPGKLAKQIMEPLPKMSNTSGWAWCGFSACQVGLLCFVVDLYFWPVFFITFFLEFLALWTVLMLKGK